MRGKFVCIISNLSMGVIEQPMARAELGIDPASRNAGHVYGTCRGRVVLAMSRLLYPVAPFRIPCTARSLEGYVLCYTTEGDDIPF
jgi:hypothetical protein